MQNLCGVMLGMSVVTTTRTTTTTPTTTANSTTPTDQATCHKQATRLKCYMLNVCLLHSLITPSKHRALVCSGTEQRGRLKKSCGNLQRVQFGTNVFGNTRKLRLMQYMVISGSYIFLQTQHEHTLNFGRHNTILITCLINC